LDWVVFPSLVFCLLFNAVDLEQCIFVCVPVVTGENQEFCALISPVFRISEQFNCVFMGTSADMMTDNKLCFRINPYKVFGVNGAEPR